MNKLFYFLIMLSITRLRIYFYLECVRRIISFGDQNHDD